jgi:hypothetical protein
MMKRYSIALFLLFAISFSAFAQYGKITGQVTDRETKEPLIGANVLLEGTALGASTDVNGNFTILNVPAGSYDLKTSYVGYQPTTMTGVSVLAGLTREMSIQLASTAVQMNAVEIVAQKPLIEKTSTNAVRVTTTEDIKNLPVRGVQGYFSLQPGVVVQNGLAYVRGSRQDEVGYMIEGANVKDIVGSNSRSSDGTNPGALVTVIPEALQEISVQAGGYGAELGGANAGIVSQTLRTGGSKLNVTLQGETDNFGNYPGKKVLGAYSYGYSDYVATVSLPVVPDKIKLFVAGENNFVRDRAPTFFTGANLGYFYDNGLSGGTIGDSALMQWPSGNVLGRMNNRYTGNGTLLFDFLPLQVRLGGAFSWSRNMDNGTINNYFDLARVGVTDNSNLLLNGKFNYFFTTKTFAEVNVNYLDQRSRNYDPIFGENVLSYNDSLANAQHGIQYVSLTSGPQAYNFNGFPFSRPGALLSGFGKDLRTHLSGSVALTSQMENHSLNIGGSYEYWTVSHYGIGGGVYSAMLTDPNAARNPQELAYIMRSQLFVNNYGYDEFGNSLSSGPDGPKHPFFAAGYLQDRIEFSDLNINAGLRYDVMNFDDWTYTTPDALGYDLANFVLSNPGKAKTYSYLEPRLGFSFPASDRTVFHMQYGKFVQAPPLYTTYVSRANALRYLEGGNFFLSPIGYNIQPVRTTQYEIGFSQQFTDAAAFDVTGFYKNTQGQLQYAYFPQPAGSLVPSFYAYTNGDFQTVAGLEFSIHVRRTNRFMAEVNYTLQDARGTNSFANSGNGLSQVAGNAVKPSMVVPLDYAETHRGAVSLDYRWDKGDGGPILERLGFNLLFTFNSGHPFTLAAGSAGQQGPELGGILNDGDSRSRFPVEPVGASTTPWFYQLDFRIDKTFSLPLVDLNIYAYVQNILNTQNVVNVYYRTGNAYDDGWLSDPVASGKSVAAYGQRYVALYQVMNLQDNQNQILTNGFSNFGMPRQIRVGAKIEF